MGGAAAVEAVADAVGIIFSTVGYGRRSEFDRQPEWLTPNDFVRQENIPYLILGGGILILVVIILASVFKKK